MMTPYHCTYDPVLNFYCVTEVGTINYQDALQLLRLLAEDANYQNATLTLSDVRLAKLKLTLAEFADYRSRLVPAPQARSAIVTNPGAQFGWYQQVKADFDGRIAMEVFTEMWTARDWLGVPQQLSA